MEKHSLARAWAQVLLGAGFGACSLWALSKDIDNNYAYFAKINADLAGIFAMTAILAFLIPAGAGFTGWSKLKVAATALFITIACWAALNVYSNDLGADILKKSGQADNYASAQADAARARETLSRITETADAATLATMTTAAKAEADRLAKADAEKIGDANACFKKCKEAKAVHMALLGRLSQAQARDKARSDLDKATGNAKSTGNAEVSMLATQIAGNTKDASGLARWFVIGSAIFGIIATQVALLISHWAVHFLAGGFAVIFSGQKPKAKPLKAVAEKSSPKPGARKAKGPAQMATVIDIKEARIKRAKRDTMAQLKIEAAQLLAKGMKMNQVAKATGLGRSTVQRIARTIKGQPIQAQKLAR
jgi:hypothetical protein